MKNHPNPHSLFPVNRANFKTTCFLKNLVNKKNIEIGDFTYYHDFENIDNFLKNVLYHYEFIGDKLIIGKFCQIGSGVKFIMNGGNHETNGISTYPFGIFSETQWSNIAIHSKSKGDTIVGNDVWIGHNVTFMPGIKIGNGVIIGANSVITKDIEDYSVVGGNPAKLIRKRFHDNDIKSLLEIAWWNWSIEKITKYADIIAHGSVENLKNTKD
jgi:virginiamycin A acetyltransferase